MAKKFDGKTAMDIFAERVLVALEESEKNGQLSWHKNWREMDTAYRNAISNKTYSGLHNILTCVLAPYSDCRYLTFNQIKKAGGKLLKGSKATYLLAWNFSKVKDRDTGEEKTIPFAKKVVLFNVEQTTGLDLPALNEDVLDESIQPNEQIMDIFKKLKVDVKHEQSNAAFYSPSSDSITMPLSEQFVSGEAHASVCIHELIHWTASRVNRDCSKYHFDVEDRAMEELVAELGAMFLSMKLKINSHCDENSLAYISSWKKGAKGNNGKKFVYKACRLAEEVCKYILENSGLIDRPVDKTEAA